MKKENTTVAYRIDTEQLLAIKNALLDGELRYTSTVDDDAEIWDDKALSASMVSAVLRAVPEAGPAARVRTAINEGNLYCSMGVCDYCPLREKDSCEALRIGMFLQPEKKSA